VTNTEIVRRYGEEIWVRGDFSNVDELLADDYIGHSGLKDRNRDELLVDVELYRAHHPNMHLDVLEQFEVGEKVVSRLRVYSAGKVAAGMNISRVVDGRIAEEWAVWTEFE
jgi:predicted SnoaL-like aldol condensation-catalyzing enzyme